jgi:ATP-binding cassette subfamily F protein 3
MLSVNRITKTYNLDLVLDQVTFSIKPHERVGLIGVNGSGKSTIMRILIGEETADSGTHQLSPYDLTVGYLSQGLEIPESLSIGAYLSSLAATTEDIEGKFQRISTALSNEPDDLILQKEYDHLLTQLSASVSAQSSVAEILPVFGLDAFDADTPTAHLSGGQKTRLILAGILMANPQLLLLDEPTNHLDISMLEWLENWLNRYQGAALIVSHDRTFLNNTVNAILRIDTRSHQIKRYEGNYTTYLEQRLNEQEREWQSYQNQQEEIARLTASAAQVRSKATFRKGGKSDVKAGTDGSTAGFFKNRALETIRRAKSIEKRVDRLMTGEDHFDKPKPDWEMKIDFSEIPESGRDVLVLENLIIGYQQPLLDEINLILRYGQRCVLTGENGSGKTTLIKTVLGQMPALKGGVRLGSNVKVGYMAQEQENLPPELNPYETMYRLGLMNETQTRYHLAKFLFKGDEVFIPNQNLSYGERARLTLACLVADGCNFLLLDEPINHLDIPSRTQFEQALSAFQGTILAVIHDRFFIERFATEIWQVENHRINQIIVA